MKGSSGILGLSEANHHMHGTTPCMFFYPSKNLTNYKKIVSMQIIAHFRNTAMQTLMCDAVDPKGTTVREDAFLFQAQNTKAHLVIACVLPPEKLRVPREAFLSNVEGEKASSFIPTRIRSSYGFSDKELKLALCVSLFKNGNSRTRGRIFLSEVILRGQFCHEEFQELDFFNPMKVFIETVLEENEALRGEIPSKEKSFLEYFFWICYC